MCCAAIWGILDKESEHGSLFVFLACCSRVFWLTKTLRCMNKYISSRGKQRLNVQFCSPLCNKSVFWGTNYVVSAEYKTCKELIMLVQTVHPSSY
jgi:hypothetical protein